MTRDADQAAPVQCGDPVGAVPALRLSAITCGHCGAAELRMIAPGHDRQGRAVVDIEERAVPLRAWCSWSCFRASVATARGNGPWRRRGQRLSRWPGFRRSPARRSTAEIA